MSTVRLEVFGGVAAVANSFTPARRGYPLGNPDRRIEQVLR